MNCNEKYEENNHLDISDIDLNDILVTVKIFFIVILILQSFTFQNKPNKLISEKGMSPEIEYKNENIITNQITDKDRLFINNYLSSIPEKYSREKENEKQNLEKYFSLIDLPENITINSDLKNKILEKIINFYKKNITKINKLFITNTIAFGNTLLCLNNVIYYCEILGCKNIYLNSSNNWHIKSNIISNKTQISIRLSPKINCKGRKTLCIPFEGGLCLNPLVIKQKLRFNIIKNEIKRNLPKVNIKPKDLYIHIRCGNIFQNEFNPSYSQPPLCFYQKILKNFKFENIYIISGSNNSPVIPKLLEQYPNIIFKNNSLELDFAYLSNAYNLVGSVSSFLITAIKFNDNLKKYWEYDIYRKTEKFLHLHHDIYKFPRTFTIYKMYPSKRYKNEMFSWRKDEDQLTLLINEKCLNSKFSIQKRYK